MANTNTYKNNCQNVATFFYLILSILIFLRHYSFYTNVQNILNTNRYLSIGLVLIKQYTAFWATINNVEIVNKNKISDILRGGMVWKKKKERKKEMRWGKKLSLKAALQSIWAENKKHNCIKHSSGGPKWKEWALVQAYGTVNREWKPNIKIN